MCRMPCGNGNRRGGLERAGTAPLGTDSLRHVFAAFTYAAALVAATFCDMFLKAKKWLRLVPKNGTF